MDLVSLPRNPVPSGAISGMFAGYDGEMLRYARWDATRGPRRGSICLFPGRSEYIEKYFETVADLRRRGFAVAIMDWRGQGGSVRPINDPRKGHIDDFAEYDQDLVRFMRDIVMPDCPPPYAALAHSMGAHIILRNIAGPSSWFERAVLVAPMVALTQAVLRYPLPLVATYAHSAALLGLSRTYVQGGSPEAGLHVDFEDNFLTTDRERFLRNRLIARAAPQLLLGSPTVGWLRAAIRSMGTLRNPDYPANVRVPALIFGAGEDVIVDTSVVESFAESLKSGTYILLPDGRHEILQENDDVRARFWATFDAYFDVEMALTA